MNCVECGERLRIRQVYLAGSYAKTQRAECAKCARVYTLVTLMVEEADEKGKGAYALAKRIEKRKDPPTVDL